MLAELFNVECTEEQELLVSALMICGGERAREAVHHLMDEEDRAVRALGVALAELPPAEANELCAEVLNRAGIDLFADYRRSENSRLERMLRVEAL